MKNIAIIISSIKVGGGAERVASLLSQGLASKGCKLHIITFYSHDNEYDFSGIRESLSESSHESKLKKLFARAKKIQLFCRKHSIDTVIAFMPEANLPLIMSKMWGNKSKIIVSERTNPLQQNIFYRLAIRFLYPYADAVVSLSRKVGFLLKKNFYLKNVIAIYNPLDIKKSDTLKQQPINKEYEYLFSKNSFVFITIGRLVDLKGHVPLIKAFSLVAQKHPSTSLIIIGEGESEQQINKTIKQFHLLNNIYILPTQSNIYPFLNKSDCFVFSSLWEGFGNVLVEALNTNRPVISPDCEAGPREIIAPEISITKTINYPYYGKWGILTKPLSRSTSMKLSSAETMLSKVMIDMIENKSLQKKYSKGETRSLDFDIKKIIQEWEKLL